MTLLAVENFNNSTNINDYSTLYNSIGGSIGYNSYLRKNAINGTFQRFVASSDSVFYGARCYISPGGSSPGAISLIGGPNQYQVIVTFNLDGTISLESNVLIQTTNVHVYSPGIPFYCEIGANVIGSTGSVTVNIDQKPVIQANIIPSLTTTSFQGFYGTSGDQLYMTDLYYCDNTGISGNVFLGDVSIQTVLCNSDYNTQFKPIGNTLNYENISTINPNPTGDYNTSNIITQTDLFNVAPIQNLISSNVTVFGVVTRSAFNGVPGHTIQQILQSGSTTTRSNVYQLNSSFTFHDWVSNVNPATNGPWTLSTVDAIYTGYQLTS
jgi:hypothetical protein